MRSASKLALIDINFVNQGNSGLNIFKEYIIPFIAPLISSGFVVWFGFKQFKTAQKEERKRWINDVYAKKEADLWLKIYPLVANINDYLLVHFKTYNDDGSFHITTVDVNGQNGLINTLQENGTKLAFEACKFYSELKPYYEARLDTEKFVRNMQLLLDIQYCYGEIINWLMNDDLKYEKTNDLVTIYRLKIADIEEKFKKSTSVFRFAKRTYTFENFEINIKSVKEDMETFKNEISAIIAGHLSKS